MRFRAGTAAAFEIELELLLDWYWPALKGAPCPPAVREEFRALWSGVLDQLLALPGAWFLRDFHSPNLIWLPERHGVARVGILDFQDALNEHAAFDLVSLLQDARIDVPAALERDLFHYYCARAQEQEAGFDRAAFAAAYAMFGAQRNTRLLGLWGATVAARRQVTLSPAYSTHMGISRPQPWRCGHGRARAMVCSSFPPHLRAGLPG